GHSVITMGVYFGAFGLLFLIAMFIAARIHGTDGGGLKSLIAIGSLVLLMGFGKLFEYLYELEPSVGGVVSATSDYVFLLDDSESMEWNDPDNKRFPAIEQIISNRSSDVKYSIYTFANSVECIRKMGTASEGMTTAGEIQAAADKSNVGGGTEIYMTLSQVLDDINNGVIQSDHSLQVILVTDGEDSDSDHGTLAAYHDKGIPITTVGLGADADMNLLEHIANETNGKSVNVNDVNTLATSMDNIVSSVDLTLHSNSGRNLLASRPSDTANNGRYMFLRILFIFILGMLFLGIRIGMTDNQVNWIVFIITSVVGSLVAALVLEFMNGNILDSFVARIIAILFIAITILIYEKTEFVGGGMDVMDLLHNNRNQNNGFGHNNFMYKSF
ncbi:MAG: vWA domain-containing protein, partial [Eubacteriales bacterium]|nr:vWA domain-containing protein [Eubacteriales bacterium]